MSYPRLGGRKPPRISISQKQDSILRTIIEQPVYPARLTQRARIIRHCATEAYNYDIAAQEKIAVSTVRRWRTRWRKAAQQLAQIEGDTSKQQLETAIMLVLCDQSCP